MLNKLGCFVYKNTMPKKIKTDAAKVSQIQFSENRILKMLQMPPNFPRHSKSAAFVAKPVPMLSLATREY
jgi:hypothetical protein